MSAPGLAIEREPEPEAVAFLSAQLNRFNLERTGIPFGGFVSAFVRDEAGEIVAGLHGFTWGDCCQIDLLWVQEARRGEGMGSRLLALAEEEARQRGCTLVVLDTHSFQAPAFYQARGYTITGAVDGYPRPGTEKIYLHKRL